MPKLKRGGVDIHYEIHGEGPVILLTHGFAVASRMWQDQIEPLSRRHRLVIWDMRGHGKSDYPADPAEYSEAATVGDMAALLDEVGAERAVVGGLSLGGYISLAFHVAHPERVKALMLIDTGPGFKKDEARAAWNETASRRAMQFDTEGLAALPPDSPERMEKHHRSADGLAHAARGMLAQRSGAVMNALAGIAVPTLIIVGANDTPFLIATDIMAAKIAGARKVVIPDAGHMANLDQPALFNDAVLAFLATLDQ